MTAMNFSDKVVNFTQENVLLSLPSTVVVGVSGGADSMALLHILCSGALPGLSVVAVHVHHGLRGDEANRDERLVRDYCAQHRIPLHVEYADVKARALEWNCGLEEAGRRVRYVVFENIRIQNNAKAIATAHTADDVIETMLMHIVRGCGVSGLVGIPARRGCIVRPLLSCTRAEIEAYCAAEHIPYIVDSSNTDLAFTRNRIRWEMLPLLRQINPAADAALQRLSAAATQDDAYLNSLASHALDDAYMQDGIYSFDGFLQQPMAVRTRMYRTLFARYGFYSFAESHIAALQTAIENNRGVVNLPNNSRIIISAGQVMRYISPATTTLFLSIDHLPFSFSHNDIMYNLKLYSMNNDSSFQNVHKMFFNSAIDYDKIQGSLTIRCRQEGDYIHPVKRKVGKSLKKWMQECHIPSHQRDAIPLICDDCGVLAVFGLGCDERVAPDNSTKHFLVWSANSEPSYEEENRPLGKE